MMEVGNGTLQPSGTKFQLFASENLTPDDLRTLGNLLHAAAVKVENDPCKVTV